MLRIKTSVVLFSLLALGACQGGKYVNQIQLMPKNLPDGEHIVKATFVRRVQHKDGGMILKYRGCEFEEFSLEFASRRNIGKAVPVAIQVRGNKFGTRHQYQCRFGDGRRDNSAGSQSMDRADTPNTITRPTARPSSEPGNNQKAQPRSSSCGWVTNEAGEMVWVPC